MPYRGPSKGCYQCRKRHIKCDETRPNCLQCTRQMVDCPGYRFQDGLLFEDETNRTVKRVKTIERRRAAHNATTALQCRSKPPTPRPIAQGYDDAAIAFFLSNFTIITPAYASRAFTHLVREWYPRFKPDSPAALATATVASELFGQWTPCQVTGNRTVFLLGRALKAIKDALSVHETAMQNDTLLAVLLLQFYTNVSSSKRLSRGSGDHQAGARALVYYRGQLNFESKDSLRLFQTVRNHLISSAVRAGVRLELDPAIWGDSAEENQSKTTELDWLGLQVAGLKADFSVMKDLEVTPDRMIFSHHVVAISTIISKAVTIEQHLRAWQNSLTPDWYPVLVAAPNLAASSITPHQSMNPETITFDAYPSVQAADTWNQYRVYRLICLQITWYCRIMQDRSAIMSFSGFTQQLDYDPHEGFTAIVNQVQELVDEICGSVPFHLGDRIERQSIEEFTNMENINYPLASPASASSRSACPVSAKDTVRALISTGSWYILGPLSFLVQNFSSQLNTSVDPPPLREGQIDWIKGQLLRIMEMNGSTENLNALGDEHIRELRGSLRYSPGV